MASTNKLSDKKQNTKPKNSPAADQKEEEEIKCDASKNTNSTKTNTKKMKPIKQKNDLVVEDTKMEEKKDKKESSDSESDEESEKEIEERKKLLHETKLYKQKIIKILLLLIAFETIVCSLLISPPSSADNDIQLKLNENKYFTNRILNFRKDTIDLCMVSTFRVIVLYLLVQIAVKWGNIKNYDENKEKHHILNIDASHYKLITNIKSYLAYIILITWNHIIGERLNKYISNNDNREFVFPKEPTQPKKDHQLNGPVITDEKKKAKRIFDKQEFVDKYSGMDAQDVADFWKSAIWMITFFVITLFQTYIGIKISFFQSGNDYYYYMSLFGLIILLTHIQTYFCKQLIDYECEPDNRYLDINVHPHPLFKIKNKGSIYCYCSICSETPDKKTKKGKFIFKCSKCSRWRSIICVKCWNKKRKEFKKQKEKNENENENEKDITFFKYFVTLFHYHLPYLHILVLGVIALATSSIISIFVPRQNGRLLDKIISGDFDGFYYAIRIQIILKVSSSVINAISSSTMSYISQQVQCDLQKKMFSNIMAQDIAFFDNNTYSEISRRMNWGLSEMLSPFQSSIRIVLSSFVSIIGSFYMCLTISWRLTFLGLSTLGPMSYLMRLFSNSNRDRWYLQHELQYEMSRISSHGISKIRTVKAFVKEHEIVNYYNYLKQESHDADNRNKLMQATNRIINSWFSLGTRLLLTWIAGIIILTNSQSNGDSNYSTNLTVGLFVTFQTYWYRLYSTMQGLGTTYSSYDQAFFMAKKIFKTLSKKSKIEYQANEIKKLNSDLINKIDGNIKFCDVEFFYESSPKKLVLKKLNLEIEKGKTTALVGRSGGGKSTLLHLILRFYDPTNGVITINDIDLKKYNPYALRRQIVLVAQDSELFYNSMEYNIGYGSNKLLDSDLKSKYESCYNLEEVYYAAKLANAHKFIEDMEEKYDTKLGSRANRCSGGQKQRISIARMLMSKPTVMLLDEATSSLDAESEALVQAAMERESSNNDCTLIIVAHRLSTVVNADKICVIDDGTVVEEGTHDELIELKGIYASLVDRQINLRSKMKKKLNKIKKTGNDKDNKDDVKDDDDDDDCDNIDKLIDQIKAEKLKKEKERKEKEEKDQEKENIIDNK